MSIEKYNFGPDQLVKIYEFMLFIHTCNNDMSSNCKIDGIQTFKDKNNNFYASYYLHGFTNDGLMSSLEYVEIDNQGYKTDLSTRYNNKADIAIKLSRYDEINLND